jgi:hypothetical protein
MLAQSCVKTALKVLFPALSTLNVAFPIPAGECGYSESSSRMFLIIRAGIKISFPSVSCCNGYLLRAMPSLNAALLQRFPVREQK